MLFGPAATVFLVLVFMVISGVKILKEYERAVIFRLGRLVAARGPGMIYVIPFIERMQRVELRTVTMEVPPQDVITKDNVSVKVSAVLYFRVIDANRAVTNVVDYLFATSQSASGAPRSSMPKGSFRPRRNSRMPPPSSPSIRWHCSCASCRR
ncbi:MAG: FtsH protease regulator HflK [Deltaproteobacteria bacterium]|nr:FtsH protease regulator HflK [Deltaproteobacteria bacterium]